MLIIFNDLDDACGDEVESGRGLISEMKTVEKECDFAAICVRLL